MKGTESLQEFYKERNIEVSGRAVTDSAHYNVFRLEKNGFVAKGVAPYCRREFYKISLIRGHNRCHYADKSLEISGPTLMFFNPNVPYTWEPLTVDTGYYCIFREPFYSEGLRGHIRELPMFAMGGKPAYRLTAEQDDQVSQIFEKMLAENASAYPYKDDLSRSYLTELIHFALKITPTEQLYQHTDANARLTAVFTELLERQFPIASASDQLKMRSAKDFAGALTVHVNHLNRALKETTGRTTTELIAARLTTEAKVLLRHTDWNISEIGYTLGFEEPAHFYNFFKKHMLQSPTRFRLHPAG